MIVATEIEKHRGEYSLFKQLSVFLAEARPDDLRRDPSRIETESGDDQTSTAAPERGDQKWLRNFGRLDKWIVCLTARTIVRANQERR